MGGHWGVSCVALLDSLVSQSAKRGRIWTRSYVQYSFLEPLPLHPVWNMALACSISLTIHCSVMFPLIVVNLSDWNPQDWDHRHMSFYWNLIHSSFTIWMRHSIAVQCCAVHCCIWAERRKSLRWLVQLPASSKLC